MTKHMIFDFETFGTNSLNCASIDCSVIFFDWERFTSDKPYSVKEYANAKRFKISVADQVKNYGWVVDDSTVEFWKSQDIEVRKKITPKDDDLKIQKFVNDFIEELINQGKVDYWWSRSNTFDPIILQRIFAAKDKIPTLNEYLKFWRVRDIRTFIDSKLDFPKVNGFIPIEDEEFWKKVFKEHDSSWDVVADLLRIQAIVRAENDLDMVKR